mmetsp:Transcript_65988/g.213530  ORF Transcript_65988/g.213530 Transcript_65988/m.213530 type:complete len:97 (+) Transcript_65988:457-747(+)
MFEVALAALAERTFFLKLVLIPVDNSATRNVPISKLTSSYACYVQLHGSTLRMESQGLTHYASGQLFAWLAINSRTCLALKLHLQPSPNKTTKLVP